jgi:hypothetical protein
MGISAILIVMVFAGANIAYPNYIPVGSLGSGSGYGNGTGSGGSHTFSDQNFTLTGNVSNLYNGLPVHGSLIISNSTMSKELNYSQNGTFKVTLPGGPYSLSYSSPGFSTMNTNILLTKNETVSSHIVPSPSIGSKISILGTNTSIIDNTLNISQSVPYLSDKNISYGLDRNNITGYKNKTITLEFGNNLGNKHFIVLITQDGTVYTYNNTTNSSGNATMSLNYSGNYTMAAYMLDYNSSIVKYNTANGNGTIKFYMEERSEFTETVKLSSNYDLNGNKSVNESTLTGYGGIFHLQTTGITINSTGTYYHYSVPAGIYRFSYKNQSFVGKPFSVDVLRNQTSSENVSAYVIVVNVTDKTGFAYSYNISGVGSNYNGNNTYRATAGQHTLNISISGKLVYSHVINLTSSQPYYQANLALNNGNFTLNGTETYTNCDLALNYTGTVISNATIIGMQVKNITFSSSPSNITINNKSYAVQGNVSNGSEFNLTPTLTIYSGELAVQIEKNHTSINHATGTMRVQVYAYNITEKGIYKDL